MPLVTSLSSFPMPLMDATAIQSDSVTVIGHGTGVTLFDEEGLEEIRQLHEEFRQAFGRLIAIDQRRGPQVIAVLADAQLSAVQQGCISTGLGGAEDEPSALGSLDSDDEAPSRSADPAVVQSEIVFSLHLKGRFVNCSVSRFKRSVLTVPIPRFDSTWSRHLLDVLQASTKEARSNTKAKLILPLQRWSDRRA